MYVELDDWLTIVEQDYLGYFISHGGAAVKFPVVPSNDIAERTRDELRRLADKTNCQFVTLDAATTKIHMIDQAFHATAKQIDWDALTSHFLRTVIADRGYKLPDHHGPITYRQIAEFNGYEESEVRVEGRNALRHSIFRDFGMAQEFRIAMMRLCQAQLSPTEDEENMAMAIKLWLRGELRLVSAVKPALIFQKIVRHNARDMFLSLAHWLRVVGKNGMVISLDMSRYLSHQRPTDGTLYHTPNIVLDAYEVLRQFVDTTDELEACFIAVITPPEFLQDPRRGLEKYAPLQTRVWNDVQDRHRANPLASLVRIQAANGRMSS